MAVESAQEGAIPQAVIAQAEAAISGNADNNGTPRHHRTDVGETGQTQHTHPRGMPEIMEPLPAYSERFDEIDINHDGLDTKAKLTDDGRINISINQHAGRLSGLLAPALRNQLALVEAEDVEPLPPGYIPPALGGLPGQVPPPCLNVVIQVVGSRGDVQPFVALGKILKATYGHRVRIATHPTFQSFVEENGLEFFSIGGDPAELMAFMVKNPGLMPGLDSLKSGDVGKRRKGMEEILVGCWRACIEPGDGLGAPVTTSMEADHISFDGGVQVDANPAERPFIADAIISNPPCFAHIHIAEKLGIPLHMMFTMPWSPTQSFPHPLANIQSSNADVNMTNFVSYTLVEMMTWQGLGDVINRFREKALGLEPISMIWAPGNLQRLRIPYTYCWSPALIPKPKDWGKHISISGFFFLSLASSYNPDPDLAAFLAAGPPPVYIGFGSIVVDDPNAMTKLIFEAVKITGVRALVSKGWGGLGGDELGVPEGVYMLGNVPHDWLFKHVSCVVHHGGAGTTAAGIALGRPTVVVPFFGDQPFWGNMTFKAGAGPVPIPFKQLTAEKLAAAITEALKPATLERAHELGDKIREEKGTEVGGKAFHDQLDIDSLRCTLSPSRVAVWRVKRTQIRLSALAATVLANEGLLNFSDLKLYRPREYATDDGPWDPISGGASALLGTTASMMMGVADVPVHVFKSWRGKSSKKDSLPESSSHSKNGSKTSPPTSRTESVSTAVPSVSDFTSNSITQEPETIENSSLEYLESSSSITTSSDGDTRTPVASPLETSASSRSSHAPRGSSLKQALSGKLGRSRSQSRERRPGSRSMSPAARAAAFDPKNVNIEDIACASKGVGRIIGAGIKSPMDFTLGIARGFHNAPKLYGDDTVRAPERITDLQSGLKAAGKEFGYGMWDGITGLVTQPMQGAKKDGAAGAFKGIAKGIGGLVLKPGAAIWGLPGYTFLGLHKEMAKLFGTSVFNYIISARTAQGYEQWKSSTPEERLDIISRWNQAQVETQSAKDTLSNATDSGRLSAKGFFQTRHLSYDERKRLHDERKAQRKEGKSNAHSRSNSRDTRTSQDLGSSSREAGSSLDLRSPPLEHRQSTRKLEGSLPPQDSGVISPNTEIIQRARPGTNSTYASTLESSEDLEHAIQQSVASTSRGNPEQDLMIERAIRASVAELQAASNADLSEEEALKRAIQASIAEANRGSGSKSELAGSGAEHNAHLERSIQASLYDTGPIRMDEDVDTDDDDDIKRVLERSKTEHEALSRSRIGTDGNDEHDEEVQQALELSKAAHEEAQKKSQAELTEEEIVLAYVKKQSLLEEEHKKKALEHRKSFVPEEAENEDDDEHLRRAIELSMAGAKNGGASNGGPSNTGSSNAGRSSSMKTLTEVKYDGEGRGVEEDTQ